MQRSSFYQRLGMIAATFAIVFHASVAAQNSTPEKKAAATNSTPVCMAKPLGNVKQVKREKRGKPLHILTIESAAKGLEDKGFIRVDCSAADFAGANFARAESKSAWRDEICELASAGNEAVQNQLERAYGERPAVLCAGAEMAAGEWKRKKKEKSKPKIEG